MSPTGRLVRLASSAFGDPVTRLDELTSARLLIVGEIHGAAPVIALQHELQRAMLDAHPQAKLHIVLEHFSVEMQSLLDEYMKGTIDFDALHARYEQIGTEGHDIKAYSPVLEHARKNPRCVLHGGFIPRPYAREVYTKGVEAALPEAKRMGWVRADEDCVGSAEHYSFFESLLSGRQLGRLRTTAPSERFRAMFPAQVIKDASMAHVVNRLEKESKGSGGEDRYLLICGSGHMGFGYGVPERIFAEHPSLRSESRSIYCLPGGAEALLDPAASLRGTFGDSHDREPTAADLCFLYLDDREQTSVALDASTVKDETKAAYDSVGNTAHIKGDLAKARNVMAALGYSEEEIQIAGSDAFNYQGVGHPHRHAAIQRGERVLDLGSGLGIDSMIASARVGPSGRVVGIDLSESEVRHANDRARTRGMNARFYHADLEELPLPDSSVDCIISNGAFCLTPDKRAGFAEAFRVLRPGGRLVVCTTTVRNDLPPETKWPICMRVFAKLDELGPMVQGVGFTDVTIDTSDSSMAKELPNDDEVSSAATVDRGSTSEDAHRNRVHGKEVDDEFRHLENFDMDELCARVVVIARKPSNDTTLPPNKSSNINPSADAVPEPTSSNVEKSEVVATPTTDAVPESASSNVEKSEVVAAMAAAIGVPTITLLPPPWPLLFAYY